MFKEPKDEKHTVHNTAAYQHKLSNVSGPVEAGHQTRLSPVTDVCEEDRRCWDHV